MLLIRKSHKVLSALIAALTALALVYWLWPNDGQPEEAPFIVETATVKTGSISKKVKLLATVKPKHQASFVSHEKGRLKAIYVKEGSSVAKGTLVAELDNDELTRELKYVKEKARIAKAHYDRINKLFQQKSQSQASLERSRDEWLRAEMESEGYQDRLKKTQIIMPFDGTCGVFKVRVGQSVSDGEQIVSCYDDNDYILNLDIPESIINHVEAGQEIEYKDKKAKIASVQKMLDSETHMGLGIAEISNTWPVSIGKLISVQVEIQKKSKVLIVPRIAVFLRDGQPFVYTIEEGQANLKPVQLGLTAQHDIEITQGVKAGEKVILRGHENIWPTRAVKEAEQKSADKKPEKSK